MLSNVVWLTSGSYSCSPSRGPLSCYCCCRERPWATFLHERIPDRPRRRLFVASVSFFLTFAGVRGVVYAIEHQIPPFHFIEVGGRHIHHLVFGIIILLLV